ncbi:hypothetical protein [Arsukibacterium sp.]|uniref:hypothetical protein n=1 Tax=Arsukibacterium sp. TaxID=1977258 RepID=UPI002FDB8CC5
MSAENSLQQRYQALQPREKKLVFFGLLLLTLWLGVMLWLEPAFKQRQAVQQQNRELSQQLQLAQQQNQQLQLELQRDLNEPFRQQSAALQQQLSQLAAELELSREQFIGSGQMLALLHDLLARSRQLELKSLATSAAKPVWLAGQSAEDRPLLYQHQTTLIVEGRFADIQQLLTQLEALPWLIQWQQLDYQVQEHPRAQVSIELITVSEYENFIQL